MKKVIISIIEYLILIGFSLGMYHYCVDLYTRCNQFSIDYHPDEWTKASQIIQEERNYNHPQLMLEAAERVVKRDNIPLTQWDVLLAGRRTSAAMAAGAALLLAWAGWFAARWIGFLAIAAGAGFCPTLLAHAHYFKEEPSLCFGIACVVCAAAAMSAFRHWAILLVLAYYMGEACGVAASGKYSGIIMLIPGLLMILMAMSRRWVILPFALLLFVIGFYYRWTEINWRAVADWDRFWNNVMEEKNHAFTEHSGVAMNKPNGYFIDATWTDAMLHIKILAILAPIALLYLTGSRIIAFFRHLRSQIKVAPRYLPSVTFGWWLILTLIIYTTGLSYSVIPFFRYNVPSILLLNVLAAIAIAWIYFSLNKPTWLRLSFVVIALGTIYSTQWLRCQDYTYQFAHDSRDELPKWIAENIKDNNPRLYVDGYTNLNASDIMNYNSKMQPSVYRTRFAGNAGSVEYLRSQGMQYVITAGTSCDRWLSPYSIKPLGDSEDFDAQRKFYTELIQKYPVVKEFKAHYPMNTFTNPDMVIYRIDQGPKK